MIEMSEVTFVVIALICFLLGLWQGWVLFKGESRGAS